MTAGAETRIRELLAAENWDAATAEVLRQYGPEILGLLVALHRGDHDEASDAFSIFAEKVWTSIEHFEERSSVRTWAYVLARRASIDVRRREIRQSQRRAPLSSPIVDQMEARVRTATLTLLRTEVKSELARLRETLPDEDQMLLVLRVDRGLSWDELVLVFHEGKEPLDASAAKREAARLRKRFQLLKEKLRTMARERGLLGMESSST